MSRVDRNWGKSFKSFQKRFEVHEKFVTIVKMVDKNIFLHLAFILPNCVSGDPASPAQPASPAPFGKFLPSPARRSSQPSPASQPHPHLASFCPAQPAQPAQASQPAQPASPVSFGKFLPSPASLASQPAQSPLASFCPAQPAQPHLASSSEFPAQPAPSPFGNFCPTPAP